MKLDEITNKKDEYYTPPYAVEPILEFISSDLTVWCPFDTKDSYFVKMLKANGNNVIYTHIWDGVDFFTHEPEEYDIIISNPPYSMKNEVLERLFSIGKPFAMLIGVVGIFESQKRFHLFKDNEFEVLYLNKRVSFFEDYEEQKPSKNPPFSSVYITSNVLPNRIVFREIDKKFLSIDE